ncbi:gametocyte-specific factor 1 homolog [Daktulosphaira vitifoliae]|uniref:gametocyte-specific factor 1 homolog n=1 Tax=Daktulosphaira vitifoliae TaxID=58002 RepID=UPI0021AA2E01|nr:gametocyte-specific factor 1 homolog [Daktulosphaira vitifoliae]
METMHISTETMQYHCPYNPSHCMPKKTVQKHIVKCPDKPSNYVNCVYNFMHAMHMSEQEAHEKVCPDRVLFDTFIYSSEDVKRPVPVMENEPPEYEYEECWDNAESVDVLKTINETSTVMRAKHGLTKSERKQHRVQLHQAHVQNEKSRVGNSSSIGTNHQQNSNQNLNSVVTSTRNDQKKNVISKPMFIGQRPTL